MMSDDEFDGYIDHSNGEDSEPSDNVPPVPDFQQPTGPSVDMTDKAPLDFLQASGQRCHARSYS